MVLLEARCLGRKEPNGANWLLQDIDLKIDGGDRIAVVGPTGSGKTLLLRALARLDPVSSGEILWRDQTVFGDDVPRFRRQAIYLHQSPTLIDGTIDENLRLPFSFRAHCDEFSPKLMSTLLEQLDRTDSFLKRPVRNLSGGEAQIVALLRAIQLQPTLLFLDEPTAALDDDSTRRIEQLVAIWFDERPDRRAWVWVSHDKQQVSRVASKIVEMNAGRLSISTEQQRRGSP
jgi:putative ABC transport system ATP-binding protein